jgi:hypothetical protein
MAVAVWLPPSVAAARWSPGPRTTWQVQFSGRLNPSIDATAFDVDMFETTASSVAALHANLAATFIEAGKAVVDIEYSLSRDKVCRKAANLGICAMRKRLSLHAWRRACP